MELTYHRKGDYLFPNLTVEEEFEVEIPDEKAEKIRTVADAVKMLDEEK